MQDVANWLKTEVYDEGVKLYLKYGKDPALKNMFSEGQTDFKRKRLKSVLQEILNNYEKPTIKKAIITRQVEHQPILASFGWPNPITDEVIRQLHNLWQPKYQELMNLQARIYEVALLAEKGIPNKDFEACQMAHRILDLDDEIEEIYAQRDYYFSNGKLPATKVEETEVVGDPVRWATEHESCKRYIRRYKHKIESNPGHPSLAKWAELLQQYEKKAAHYKKLLKLDQ